MLLNCAVQQCHTESDASICASEMGQQVEEALGGGSVEPAWVAVADDFSLASSERIILQVLTNSVKRPEGSR